MCIRATACAITTSICVRPTSMCSPMR
jgi:hypothetical protein